MAKDIVDVLHGSYRDPLHGIVVVSPRVLVRAAEEIVALRAKVAELDAKVTDAGWQRDYDRDMFGRDFPEW